MHSGKQTEADRQERLRLFRELREAVQQSDSALVGEPVDAVVEQARIVRDELWNERLSGSSSTPTSSSSR